MIDLSICKIKISFIEIKNVSFPPQRHSNLNFRKTSIIDKNRIPRLSSLLNSVLIKTLHHSFSRIMNSAIASLQSLKSERKGSSNYFESPRHQFSPIMISTPRTLHKSVGGNYDIESTIRNIKLNSLVTLGSIMASKIKNEKPMLIHKLVSKIFSASNSKILFAFYKLLILLKKHNSISDSLKQSLIQIVESQTEIPINGEMEISEQRRPDKTGVFEERIVGSENSQTTSTKIHIQTKDSSEPQLELKQDEEMIMLPNHTDKEMGFKNFYTKRENQQEVFQNYTNLAFLGIRIISKLFNEKKMTNSHLLISTLKTVSISRLTIIGQQSTSLVAKITQNRSRSSSILLLEFIDLLSKRVLQAAFDRIQTNTINYDEISFHTVHHQIAIHYRLMSLNRVFNLCRTIHKLLLRRFLIRFIRNYA